MLVSEASKKAHRKPPSMVVFIMLLLIGLHGLSRVMEKPQFASYRTVDVVQLLVCGACLGASLAGVIFSLLRPRA